MTVAFGADRPAPLTLTAEEEAILRALTAAEETLDIVSLTRAAGLDPTNFFRNGLWVDIDFRAAAIDGVSFAGAVLIRPRLFEDQLAAIRASGATMIEAPRVARRPPPEPEVEGRGPDTPDAKNPGAEDRGEDWEQARQRIQRVARSGENELDLRYLRLRALPAEIAGLTALKRLYLWGTAVSDLAPLAGLTAIERLDLQGTLVTDLSPLAGLTALQYLHLINTPVTDVSPLAGLTALEVLDLDGTPVTDVSPLAGLTALELLDLRGTPVTDVSPLAGLTALQFLHLNNTRVTDISPLAGLTDLEIFGPKPR